MVLSDIALRVMLSGAIIVCCAFAGRTIARVDMRRAKILAETMDSLQLLRIHMLEGMLPLNTALNKSAGYILRSVGEMMADMAAAEAWLELSSRQTSKGGALDCLTSDDCAVLDRFFFILGRSSRNEQQLLFDSAIKELGILENAARTGGNLSILRQMQTTAIVLRQTVRGPG